MVMERSRCRGEGDYKLHKTSTCTSDGSSRNNAKHSQGISFLKLTGCPFIALDLCFSASFISRQTFPAHIVEVYLTQNEGLYEIAYFSVHWKTRSEVYHTKPRPRTDERSLI